MNYARIFKTFSEVTSADSAFIEQRVQRMHLDGVWAGEEAILTAADFLQRELHIFKYMTSSGSSPSIYAPVSDTSKGPPLGLAFYEQGHFHAVFSNATSCSAFIAQIPTHPTLLNVAAVASVGYDLNQMILKS